MTDTPDRQPPVQPPTSPTPPPPASAGEPASPEPADAGPINPGPYAATLSGSTPYGAEQPAVPEAKSGRTKIIARSAIGLAVAGAIGWYGIAGQADRNEDGEVVDGGSVDVMTLVVGDCLNDGLDDGGGEQLVSSIEATPCNEPHTSQIIARFDLTQDEFPGEDAIAAAVDSRCEDLISASLSRAADAYELSYIYFYPSAETWESESDREVLCGLASTTEMTESILLGSAG